MTLAQIKGSRVIIKDSGGDITVDNVLIGNPSDNGRSYTLGIPKTDTNVWTDRRLEFWGRTFRTVGLPEEGEVSNIPLDWRANIRAEITTLNGACTVYEYDTGARHLFPEVSITDTRGEGVTRNALDTAGKLTISILSCAPGDGYSPRPGDIIVPQATELELDKTTEQAFSESVKALRQACPGYAVIKGTARTPCGLLDDLTLEAV